MASPQPSRQVDKPTERKRRAPGEARILILAAAQQLFAEQGYAGTSTRQIADAAEVAEPLLFRYFGTKAGLFDAAMLEPYREFINDFMDQWREELTHPEEMEELTRRFVIGLQKLMRDNRQLFLSLIAAKAFETSTPELKNGSGESELSRQLDEFDQLLKKTTPRPKYLDSEVSFRLIVGAVMAASVLDDWLFPSGRKRPSDERILRELTQFTLYGVFGRRPR